MVQLSVYQQLRAVDIQPFQLRGQDLALGRHEQRVQRAFELFKVTGSRRLRTPRPQRIAQPRQRGVRRRVNSNPSMSLNEGAKCEDLE